MNETSLSVDSEDSVVKKPRQENAKTPQERVYDIFYDAFLYHLKATHGLTKRHHQMYYRKGMYDAFTEAMNVLMKEFPELVHYANSNDRRSSK